MTRRPGRSAPTIDRVCEVHPWVQHRAAARARRSECPVVPGQRSTTKYGLAGDNSARHVDDNSATLHTSVRADQLTVSKTPSFLDVKLPVHPAGEWADADRGPVLLRRGPRRHRRRGWTVRAGGQTPQPSALPVRAGPGSGGLTGRRAWLHRPRAKHLGLREKLLRIGLPLTST